MGFLLSDSNFTTQKIFEFKLYRQNYFLKHKSSATNVAIFDFLFRIVEKSVPNNCQDV